MMRRKIYTGIPLVLASIWALVISINYYFASGINAECIIAGIVFAILFYTGGYLIQIGRKGRRKGIE